MAASRVPPPVLPPVAPTEPDDIAALDPLTDTWAAGSVILRCYDIAWAGARMFHAGDAAHRGRFHPLVPVGASEALPVLYGADSEIGALSETVFHDVPVRGSSKRVPKAKLNRRALVKLVPKQDLLLVDLTSEGLSRLGLDRLEMIESDARSYPRTAAWARALHAARPDAQGLLWVSRQHDRSRCVVLFGDRLQPEALDIPEDEVFLTLGAGAGLDLVCTAADRAGITITGL